MDKRVLIICRGIQGSGKSTWAKQWCHEDPEHRVRFNNDDIRNMLGDYWVPNREKLVTEAKANMITFALIKGYDVVVDNMNLNPKEDEWIRTLCSNIEKDKGIHVDIEYKDFWTPVEECIRRDAMRPNPIGEKVIRQTWRRYKDFIIHEEIMAAKAKSLVQDTNLPAAIIVDMDATVCLNTSGRPFYGEGNCYQGYRIWDSSCGHTRARGYKPLWVVDVDSKDENYLNTIIEIVNSCRGAQDIKVKHVIPTAHGYHLITIGFDTNQFAQQLAIRNLDSIDIQKDNPTLLYFDTAD